MNIITETMQKRGWVLTSENPPRFSNRDFPSIGERVFPDWKSVGQFAQKGM